MYLGRCECKSVCYQYNGEPLTCYACHCTDCQTSSGSAFSLSMIVNDKDIKLIKGKVGVTHIDVNGTEVKKHYCTQCNTPFMFSADEYSGMAILKAGTFEDTSWFEPVAHIWTRSAQPWVKLDDATAQYEKHADISELIDLWVSKNA